MATLEHNTPPADNTPAPVGEDEREIPNPSYPLPSPVAIVAVSSVEVWQQYCDARLSHFATGR